jgi:putative hydrolase of the HAD superfamily
MNKIRVVSFDLEGTLVTPDFSKAVWYEGIPYLYAKRHDITLEKAKAIVREKYQEVGDQREEWYDIKYWFSRFRLDDYRNLLEYYKHEVSKYPDVLQVLSSLKKKYTLIVTTATAREFLPHLLDGLEGYFVRIFSSISDYSQIKSLQFYTTVCEEMGVKPFEMVHIGDSWDFDFRRAKEAGIRVFHLDRARKSKNDNSLASLTELETRL